MHSQFTPFMLDRLNKGELLAEINSDMAQLQQAMTAYANKYGAEAEKAKAVLTLKIAIICVDPNSRQFAVKVESSSTLPKRPTDVAVAFIDEDEATGQGEMVVRTFASRRENKGPKLPFGKEPADGGEDVNPDTGEIREKNADGRSGQQT